MCLFKEQTTDRHRLESKKRFYDFDFHFSTGLSTLCFFKYPSGGAKGGIHFFLIKKIGGKIQGDSKGEIACAVSANLKPYVYLHCSPCKVEREIKFCLGKAPHFAQYKTRECFFCGPALPIHPHSIRFLKRSASASRGGGVDNFFA